ncbi:GTPase [Pseudomonas sp. NW5]|uniref:GTPase n=1 Tax=Pseudomonas sp. NW5 TaxID=2934934 RepID=UPI00202198F4|nr:GTPase [Pseudomonas sp. NW5]MCL7461277.1 GTPase [Pseudomonas sp. NW5]
MTDNLSLILEDAAGERRESSSARLAIRLEGRELWLEPDGQGGLMIYAESVEGESDIPLLVMRPQAVNQLSLAVELEPIDTFDHDDDEAEPLHEHGADCGCNTH